MTDQLVTYYFKDYNIPRHNSHLSGMMLIFGQSINCNITISACSKKQLLIRDEFQLITMNKQNTTTA
jgi:hypothetical protein